MKYLLLIVLLAGCGKQEVKLEFFENIPSLYKCDSTQLDLVTKYVNMCYAKGMGTGYIHSFCVDTGIKNFCTLKAEFK